MPHYRTLFPETYTSDLSLTLKGSKRSKNKNMSFQSENGIGMLFLVHEYKIRSKLQP